MSVVLAVHVSPRSSRDVIEGVGESGELRVRVTAPPAEGAANAVVGRLLATSLGVPKSAVDLLSGAASRHKRFRIEAVAAADVLERWPGADVRER